MIKNIEKAISENADLVVFPELSLTGYLVKDMVPNVAIKKTASQKSCWNLVIK